MTPIRALVLALAVAAPGLVACVGESKVVRVYDGRIVEGPFVPPEAYAEYLKGVLAEEAGDLRSALAAYEQAAREDDEDPEPFTRIGDTRCRLDPKDKAADEALDHALKIDRAYEPARAARARCAGLRGRPADGLRDLDHVAAEDRTSVSLEALFVRLSAGRAPSADDRLARERAVALTIASGEHVAAWEALIAWGSARSDGELFARGLEGLVRVAPLRSHEVEAGALELLGLGQDALARRVAAALADLPDDHGARAVHDPTVARLAVDEAILAADGEAGAARVGRRAVRGHVSLAEVAARALLLERPETARRLARTVAAADPGSGAAQMVVRALEARDGRAAPAAPPPADAPTDRPAAACALVFAERLALAGGAEIARSWLASVAPAAMAAHDPVTGPLAVDLAARGVLPEGALPLELRLELAARRREAPPQIERSMLEGTAPRAEAPLDAKHALLWHALRDPGGAEASRLLARMSGAADRDPIIGFALARAALASNQGPGAAGWAAVLHAIASSPSHPLLLAVAVELAKRAGRADDLPPARARLMAVARTPAERALAAE